MKILITGFFGEGNLGDETILQAICNNLLPGIGSITTSGTQMQAQTRAIRRRGLAAWPAYLCAARESRFAVFSGGILQDWSFEGVTFFALRIIAASLMGCEPTLWGAGVGPLRSVGAKQIARRALRRVKIAWLRDAASVDIFNELAPCRATLGTDWSWNFPVKWQKEPPQNAPMGLNLRKWPSNGWREQMAHQLRHNERKIAGLAARKGDIQIIRELAPTASVFMPVTFVEFADICRNLSFGVAMRYHAALAMLRAGVPVKFVAYDSKVSALARSANILTLQQNQISDFRQAREGFCGENEERFALMQQAFKDMLSREHL